MNNIESTIAVYEKLRKFQYRILIENGMQIILRFSREHYHHLAGFQHLTDMPDIAQPRRKDQFYNRLSKGEIAADRLVRSAHYSEIEERIQFFSVIEEILAAGEGKVIVEFDPDKTDSVIKAKFHLFRRNGIPYAGKAIFYILFLDRGQSDIYFPVTYVVEHSNKYVINQKMYNCKIEQLPLKQKKALVGV